MAPLPHFVEIFRRVMSALHATVPFERAVLVVPGEANAVDEFECRPGAAEAVQVEGRTGTDSPDQGWPTAGMQPTLVGDPPTLLVAPLGIGAHTLGLVLLHGQERAPYGAGHVSAVGPFLEVVSIAIERERLWAVEQRRHRRHEHLAALLPAIAGELDVRKTFLELATAIQRVVPHDLLAFGLVNPDGKSVRLQAATHTGLLELPEYRFTNPEETHQADWQFLLAHDLAPEGADALRARISPRGAELVEVVVRPGPAWVDFVTRSQARSTMRIPIRLKERRLGGIVFFSRRTDAYDEEDAVLGGRIADHVALALAHQELAQEERRIAEAEARAQILEIRVDQLSRELERFSAHRALGVSVPWKQALADATRVAGTDTTVLITGESGTGKEVVARFIHRGSPRSAAPFVALNCAALPTELLESELFGHERGAFTGAVAARIGKIEQATGGVLFLDEVGEMSPVVQAKFLRVLQEREYQRLGGTRTLKANVRIIAATNRDPRRAVEDGLFREDLYYRLSVFEIHLPPLRDRPEDILVLARGFLEELGSSIGRPSAGISEDATAVLLGHSWPGNVRELRNAIERALILCHGGLITREHLPLTVIPAPIVTAGELTAQNGEFPPGGIHLEEVERDMVLKALTTSRGNKTRAAKLLGLSRGRLYSLMRRYKLTDARR